MSRLHYSQTGGLSHPAFLEFTTSHACREAHASNEVKISGSELQLTRTTRQAVMDAINNSGVKYVVEDLAAPQ
eukprot:675907-Amphidinium_carterae.1